MPSLPEGGTNRSQTWPPRLPQGPPTAPSLGVHSGFHLVPVAIQEDWSATHTGSRPYWASIAAFPCAIGKIEGMEATRLNQGMAVVLVIAGFVQIGRASCRERV